MPATYGQYLQDKVLNAICKKLNWYHNYRHNWWFGEVLLAKEGIDSSNPDDIDAQWETKFITLGIPFSDYASNFVEATAYAKSRCFRQERNAFYYFEVVKRWQEYFNKYGKSEEFKLRYKKNIPWVERLGIWAVLKWYNAFDYSDFPY